MAHLNIRSRKQVFSFRIRPPLAIYMMRGVFFDLIGCRMYQIFKTTPTPRLRRRLFWLPLCVLAFANGTTWANQSGPPSVDSQSESHKQIEAFLMNAGGKTRSLRPSSSRLFYLEKKPNRTGTDRVRD